MEIAMRKENPYQNLFVRLRTRTTYGRFLIIIVEECPLNGNSFHQLIYLLIAIRFMKINNGRTTVNLLSLLLFAHRQISSVFIAIVIDRMGQQSLAVILISIDETAKVSSDLDFFTAKVNCWVLLPLLRLSRSNSKMVHLDRHNSW